MIKVTNKGLGTCFSKKSEQIGPILVKICVFKSFFRLKFGRPDIFRPAKTWLKAQNRLKKAQKVVKKVINMTKKGPGTCFGKKSEKIGPFLVKISVLKELFKIVKSDILFTFTFSFFHQIFQIFEVLYLLQFASYSVLDGVFGMPSSSNNNYINVSMQGLDEGNQVNVSECTFVLSH